MGRAGRRRRAQAAGGTAVPRKPKAVAEMWLATGRLWATAGRLGGGGDGAVDAETPAQHGAGGGGGGGAGQPHVEALGSHGGGRLRRWGSAAATAAGRRRWGSTAAAGGGAGNPRRRRDFGACGKVTRTPRGRPGSGCGMGRPGGFLSSGKSARSYIARTVFRILF